MVSSILRVVSTIAVVLAVSPVSLALPSQATSLPMPTIYKRYRPAIVRIEVKLHGASLGVGSGFFVSSNGEIATSLHVVRPALAHRETRIEVKLASGKILHDVQVGRCGDLRGIDLCLLKVSHAPEALLTPSRTEVNTGEAVATVGHPRGLDFSLSTGVVSAVRKHPGGWGEIQIDAAISPGNSGGPVINRFGEVIGVVYQFERDGQNLNFALDAGEVQTLRRAPKPFQSLNVARAAWLAESQRRAQQTLTSLSVRRSKGLKWFKLPLGREAFYALLPGLFANCEKAEAETGVAAATCSSLGGDLILTVQKRARSLPNALSSYRGQKLVAPAPLAIVDRLESEGLAADIARHAASFRSRPSISTCSELGKASLHAASPFARATALCRFNTENDTEPGAVSTSQWIEVHGDFYGVNVWSIDPGQLPLARALIDLLVESAAQKL